MADVLQALEFENGMVSVAGLAVRNRYTHSLLYVLLLATY